MYLVAAYDLGLGMGYQHGLPWPTLRPDLDRLMQVSAQSPCIMGRGTYAGLPRSVLRAVDPIVISRTSTVRMPGHTVVRSLDEALAVASLRGPREPAIWGGTQLFIAALHHPSLTHAYLTRVLDHFPADTYFPHDLLIRTLPTEMALSVATDPATSIRYRFIVRSR